LAGLLKYGDYYHWENYVVLVGRVGGVFIDDFMPNYNCIKEGLDAQIGHDVGLCISRLISLMIDSII
jgi:hypothetical protein